MNLTPDEVGTLQQLRARNGGTNRFVGISAAQALTALGLASRTRQGWSITGEGTAWLDANPRNGGRDLFSGEVIAFAPRTLTAQLH